MVAKKGYSRYFIILQEDEKGYSSSLDKIPSGYVKLENKNDKCKICYYVQNLKKENSPYGLILICKNKDGHKTLKLGELTVLDPLKTEINFEIPANDILDSGMSFENICGAAVIKIIEKDIISVLYGFLGSDIANWKDALVLENSTNKEEIIEEIPPKEPEEEITEEIKEEIKEEAREENNEIINESIKDESREEPEEKNIFDEYEESIEKAKEAEVNCCNPPEEPISAPIEEEVKDDYPKGAASDFFMDVVADFEEIKDVCSEIKRCKWYKIKVNRLEDISDMSNFNRYTVAYYPMISYYPYIKKHGHYLIGYKCDKNGYMKYIVYGIPGRKSKYEQPYMGKSGFVTWVPMDDSREDEESFGYWLMFYDFRNSTIVIPV